MALKKEQKTNLIKEFSQLLKDSASVVFVTFKNIGVNDTNSLRRKLKDQSVGYRVVKKTLLGRALAELAPTGETPALTGEVALAYLPPARAGGAQAGGHDSLAPAREIQGLIKEHKDKLSILGGIFEGVFKNSTEMIELALIPSREVLLSRLLYLFNSPMQRLAIAISEVAKTKN
ncbi:50S ribosomal protein L10 [Candidatus Nomurabacteria bacterium RIFCSPLOWO2_02_FULL_42_17]|uniref:Large ribosomal subunit protein uL10 n=1 Tax=Candidatus Nomurabacteria bacterium RIFCSPLOWO2_02_FULL_42_17 TaxID=1801789 RepID=A0A1F6XRQ3_9BACT|nr:MAG: 50S ribosomal protein L10 [Microgenomates group bacterium GW2011_GWA2_46_16]OGI96795.1 MAG: 50S ribosomal protein L10 [Candidatus Nomurabacteria bacterium RIFCSPLOWO2_02_FULL_42_17]